MDMREVEVRIRMSYATLKVHGPHIVQHMPGLSPSSQVNAERAECNTGCFRVIYMFRIRTSIRASTTGNLKHFRTRLNDD